MSDHEQSVYTPETLDGYFKAAAATHHTVGDTGIATLVIEPASKTIRLRTPAEGPEAEVARFDRLSFELVEDVEAAERWYELTIAADGVAYEAYTLAVSIVDEMEAGRPYRAAVEEALETFKDLLSPRARLSYEQEIGLFGELGVYDHLVDALGEESATRAWVGPKREEHDFVLESADLEVKSTRAEARIHMIGSATQLEPSPGRPLHLVSLQFTAAGAAAQGETLPARINRIRSILTRSRSVFDEKLTSAGWDDRDAFELYRRRYIPRSRPRAFIVDDDFPAITSATLNDAVPHPELVVSVNYRIDLSSAPWQDPPSEIAAFAEGAAHAQR